MRPSGETQVISVKSSPAPPRELFATFKQYYGPTMNAFDAAEKDGKADDLLNQLVELAKAQNKGSDGGTAISATFMRVTVQL